MSPVVASFADSTTVHLSEAVAYRRPFGPLATAGCAIPADPTGLLGGWTFNQSATLVLDLAQLPLPGGGAVTSTGRLRPVATRSRRSGVWAKAARESQPIKDFIA